MAIKSTTKQTNPTGPRKNQQRRLDLPTQAQPSPEGVVKYHGDKLSEAFRHEEPPA
ncbi:MAG: hypothetical protein J2P17_07965 [Mycobacterium sp.]|nr:hypothetical protein [Mycobacterium sp.]